MRNKQKSKRTVAAAVMSTFAARGTAVSKCTDKMALENGVDIVIELPYIYAVQKRNYSRAAAFRFFII